MQLKKELIIKKLLGVLKKIEKEGDYEEIQIDPNKCLVKSVPQFDSQIWITSIAMLAEELNAEIPENVNIFYSEDGKDCLTLDQVAQRVLDTLKKGGSN